VEVPISKQEEPEIDLPIPEAQLGISIQKDKKISCDYSSPEKKQKETKDKIDLLFPG
jgi:hypothetical protein